MFRTDIFKTPEIPTSKTHTGMWNKIRKISTKLLYKFHTSALNPELLINLQRSYVKMITFITYKSLTTGKDFIFSRKGRKKFALKGCIWVLTILQLTTTRAF